MVNNERHIVGKDGAGVVFNFIVCRQMYCSDVVEMSVGVVGFNRAEYLSYMTLNTTLRHNT